jgi:enoyl-CoA hydratase
MTDSLAGAPEPEPQLVRVEFPAGDGPLANVALVTLDRPRQLNALSFALVEQLDDALQVLDSDETCRAIVITGAGERAFAAGADITDLLPASQGSLHDQDPFRAIDRIGGLRTPVIAAVRGFALGGGAELAMACDMLIAGEDAQFGQPEIKIGVIPGAGGTQRLARAIGKAKTMEMVLTGRRMTARDADELGLVTEVVTPAEHTLARALELAGLVAQAPRLAVEAAKAAVIASQQLTLQDGIRFERDRFEALFGTEDQVEGMQAFLEKRAPAWRHR